MKVRDFLITKFCKGSKDKSVYDILKCWMKDDSNIYVVLDDDEVVIGVVTIHDLLKRLLPFYLQVDEILSDFAFDDLLTKEKVEETMEMTAGDIMTCDVVTVNYTDNFLKAGAAMFSFEFDYLPVVDEKGRCKGLVTRNTMEEAIMEIVKKHLH